MIGTVLLALLSNESRKHREDGGKEESMIWRSIKMSYVDYYGSPKLSTCFASRFCFETSKLSVSQCNEQLLNASSPHGIFTTQFETLATEFTKPTIHDLADFGTKGFIYRRNIFHLVFLRLNEAIKRLCFVAAAYQASNKSNAQPGRSFKFFQWRHPRNSC
jgi:hypothetical protein